jgi:glycosyltransferase involved in cell wall biosynthesis
MYCVATMDVGGSELNALRTAQLLDPDRFTITIATLAHDGPLFARYQDAGIRVVRFPITSLYDRSALREGIQLYRLLRRERVALVHCHDLYSNVFAVPWSRLARVPAVIASRRWIHAVDDHRLELANRMTYKLAHRVLGNSGAVARLLRDGDGVAEARILQVPNFVDERAFTPLTPASGDAFRRELGIPPGTEIVGCIARLAAIKDHATLLRAVSLIAGRRPSLHVVLVGDGECRRALELLAADLGIAARTHFAGYRPNIPNLNHFFDVAALASLSEGFSNSVVEAMAAGRPIVATDVGGNSDAVGPSTGILVPPAHPPTFARALERVLADPVFRRRLGLAAREVARSRYHVDSVIPELESIYGRLVTRARTA